MVILSFISIIPGLFYLKESPKQLFKKGRVYDLFTTLETISKRNKSNKSLNQLQAYSNTTYFDLETVVDCKIVSQTSWKTQKKVIKNLLKDLFFSKYFIRLICMIVICSTMSVIFFGITYNTGKMGLPSIQIDLIFSVTIGGLSYFILIF